MDARYEKVRHGGLVIDVAVLWRSACAPTATEVCWAARCRSPSRRCTGALFPNIASCQRLVTAVVMEVAEEWQTGRRYLGSEDE